MKIKYEYGDVIAEGILISEQYGIGTFNVKKRKKDKYGYYIESSIQKFPIRIIKEKVVTKLNFFDETK